jgi:hypothetical protein
MNCELAKRQLSLLLYDELSLEEEEILQQHLDGCEKCRQALASEKAMHEALDLYEAAPPSDLLAQCRRDLRSSLATVAAPSGLLDQIRAFLRQPMAAGILRPVGALALVAAGFFAARLVPLGDTPGLADATLAGPVATQVRYVEPDPSGNVRIVLDETRQRVVSGSLEDELIRRLLLAAARESSNPGLRVESMDILSRQTDLAEARQALTQALEHDPNPGVRLRAMEGLKSFASDPEIRPVLTRVLLTDENPGVRTQAIDLLVEHKGVSMAGVLQELLQKEDNNYVRLRCQKALRDMNASVETF